MEDLRPGLRRWTTFHPEWKQVVGCLALETSDGLVLIDPLEPPLDELGEPRHVLVSVFWHARDTRAVAERFPSVRIWAPSRGAAAIARRAPVTDRYRPGEELPGGVQALPTARATEVVFWLPEQRALAAGDVLLGDGKGGVRLCPDSWLPSGRTSRELAESLRPALDLPIELVVVSHGEPVLENGRAALAAALEG
jgi:glyoxylase-like metal-dependent hydrolase (beta-lactamase superfamily II)